MTDNTKPDDDEILVKLAFKHSLGDKLTYEKGAYCVDYPSHSYSCLFKDIKQLCIKSDEAREYWTNPIQRDYEWESYIAKGRERFIDQACEAVDFVHTNSKAPGFNNGYDHCKEKVKQAIRDRFNAASD